MPATALEVHVLAHVLCTLATYAIWIDKPYDISAPILIDNKRVRELLAFWMCGDEDVRHFYFGPCCDLTAIVSIACHSVTYKRTIRKRLVTTLYIYYLLLMGRLKFSLDRC